MTTSRGREDIITQRIMRERTTGGNTADETGEAKLDTTHIR